MTVMNDREKSIALTLTGKARALDVDAIAAQLGREDEERIGSSLSATLRAMQRKGLADSFGPFRKGGKVKWILTTRGQSALEDAAGIDQAA